MIIALETIIQLNEIRLLQKRIKLTAMLLAHSLRLITTAIIVFRKSQVRFVRGRGHDTDQGEEIALMLTDSLGHMAGVQQLIPLGRPHRLRMRGPHQDPVNAVHEKKRSVVSRLNEIKDVGGLRNLDHFHQCTLLSSIGLKR